MPPPTIPRPVSYPYAQYLHDASEGNLEFATVTEKKDGFCIKIVKVGDTDAYFTKRRIPIRITNEPETMMEAIVFYLKTKAPTLSPSLIMYDGENWMQRPKYADELWLEFVALKDEKPYMRGLWTKECLDPETKCLNEKDFSYSIVPFDCVFEEDDLCYFKRREVLIDSIYNLPDCDSGYVTVPEAVFSAKELLDTLEKTEGVVIHNTDGKCLKVKMPHVVMKLCIVAVENTIDDFAGYNRIYVAAPNDDDGATWSVVHVFDWTDLFTQYNNPKEGRAYINPKSVKIMEDRRLGCTSSCKSMQPLVDAVFRAVSSCPRLPAVKGLTKTKAVARVEGGTTTIMCGANRSFSFTKESSEGPLFLFNPVPVTVGCGELWALKNEELHLQPAWLLALEGYGPEAYMTMQCFTTMRVLREIASNSSNDPTENYKKVGMDMDPFLGYKKQILLKMKPRFFHAEL